MEGVSGRAIAFAAEGALCLGVDPYALVREVPVELGFDLDAASRANASVPWSSFVAFSKRIGEAVGGADGLRELGRQAGQARSFRVFEVVGRALTHPVDIYSMGVRWVGPALFPMVPGRIQRTPDGRIREILEIDPGYEPCPELFHVMHGALAEMPRGWGHERSDVELELAPRGATYTIRTHGPGHGRFRRWLRRLSAGRSLGSLMEELEGQQQSLQRSYWEVREARDRIAKQALALERVDEIGRRLSGHIEGDQLANALVGILSDDLGFRGVAVEFGSQRMGDGTDAIVPGRIARAAGVMTGPPDFQTVLRSGENRDGELLVWFGDRREAAAESESVLERLLPWITIALDNAMTHDELRRHADVLEARVRERTARLVSANHRLVGEIEERERAAEALLESEAQLRESERLASVGTLAAGIAHEINNPIGSILAAAQFAQVAREGRGEEGPVDGILADIVRESRRCGDIVRSVLQFARDERTEKWDCALDDLLRRAVRLTKTESSPLEANVRLTLPPAPVQVHVNPIEIEQAIVQLVRNAVEAGSRNVHVRLEARVAERVALIKVTDDGPGISEVDRVRIFEPFYTTRRREGRIGLGLSVVHGVASEHGGQLKIDSSESGGLAVLLELPTIAPPAAPLEKPNDRP